MPRTASWPQSKSVRNYRFRVEASSPPLLAPQEHRSFSIQYINVGVNLDITPRVLLTREISLVVNVVVSALAGNRDVGGVILPVLTNRSVQHEIRLKEGETNILGGIITDTNSTTITGLPILSKFPF